MITEICMKNVASFKQATLNTDKRINLIYGLNGVGKSTISNYFYDVNQPCFSNCSHSSTSQAPILVYNQKFIHDNFFVQDSLKGIFSLSKKTKRQNLKLFKPVIIKTSFNKLWMRKLMNKNCYKNHFKIKKHKR
ncbi:AAA family ATPase [Aggregatibacter aphrophilus]|uniref:AAA family ATPase n=1 Tax=Aggregatibacter aphrophilus TaxID=732 RepID=UPI000D6E8626|nr:AAA family ATPase [Aggregatibacter aphrophilus]